MPSQSIVADSSRSICTIHPPLSDLPLQIESESEVKVKSLDRIKALGSEQLIVRRPRTSRGPPESDGKSHLQLPLLRALFAQISTRTPRTATSTRSNAGSKEEAGQAKISSKKAT